MHTEKNERPPKCPLTEECVSMLHSAEHYLAGTNYVYDIFMSWEIFMSSGQVKKREYSIAQIYYSDCSHNRLKTKHIKISVGNSQKH